MRGGARKSWQARRFYRFAMRALRVKKGAPVGLVHPRGECWVLGRQQPGFSARHAENDRIRKMTVCWCKGICETQRYAGAFPSGQLGTPASSGTFAVLR